METLVEKINYIQVNLNAPKNLYNSFGKYNYRNLEGIFIGLKPLLKETGCIVTVSDEMVSINSDEEFVAIDKNGSELYRKKVGFRIYVKATATISDGKDSYSVTAYAREDDTKKGMDLSQLTGSCSSYSRKYAMNGLFAIDDTVDADGMDNSSNGASSKPKQQTKTNTTDGW